MEDHEWERVVRMSKRERAEWWKSLDEQERAAWEAEANRRGRQLGTAYARAKAQMKKRAADVRDRLFRGGRGF
jgi:hypothetical protein